MTHDAECDPGNATGGPVVWTFARTAAGVALAVLATVTGCYAHEAAYVEADVPANVEVYPSTYYEGHVVYLVGDRWYARRQGRWVYYADEPAPLYRYRVHVHRAPHAPPAYRYDYDHERRWRYRESAPGYVAPPARVAPRVRVAPPAAAPPARFAPRARRVD